MSSFQDGYSFLEKNIGVLKGADNASLYVSRIENEIETFTKVLNEKGATRVNVGTGQFQGNVAEFWHANTFNINALARESTNRAFVPESNKLGSIDVSTNFGSDYSLKYISNPKDSALEQATTIYERYKRLKGTQFDSLEDFMQKRQMENLNPQLSIYQGQGRIIPTDQLSQAEEYLKKRINKELYNRPEQAAKYQETLAMLDDRVRDGEGTESIPLSRPDSGKLASVAQQGKVDAECLKQYGLSLEDVVKYEYVFKQALKAGTTAAVITMTLKLAPEILKTISYLIKTGRLKQNQFKSMGLASLSGASQGFARGSIAAGLTTACKAGLCGASLKNVSPNVIGALTVLTMEAIGDAYSVACGKKEGQEMAINLIRNMAVSSSALICGGLTQAALFMLPSLGFMLGSFIGATLGSFACKVSGSAILSLCVDTGFTMFGLVDQNYELPQEVFDNLGIDSFKIESFNHDVFTPGTFEIDEFHPNEFIFDCFAIKPLRRGVISVSKIGYV